MVGVVLRFCVPLIGFILIHFYLISRNISADLKGPKVNDNLPIHTYTESKR